MRGAILKLSFNKVGETPLIGGICGTCFAISSHVLLTADHVLSKDNFKPNTGFRRVQYWALLESGQNFEIFTRNLHNIPLKDTCIIYTSKWIKGAKYEISQESIIQ